MANSVESGTDGQLEDRIGNVLSIVFLAALAALFLYAYLPKFL